MCVFYICVCVCVCVLYVYNTYPYMLKEDMPLPKVIPRSYFEILILLKIITLRHTVSQI